MLHYYDLVNILHGDWLVAHCCMWGYTEQPIKWFWWWLIQNVPLTWSKAQAPECVTAAAKDSQTQEYVNSLPRYESNVNISASTNYEPLTRMIICNFIHFFKSFCSSFAFMFSTVLKTVVYCSILNWKRLEVRTLTTCWIRCTENEPDRLESLINECTYNPCFPLLKPRNSLYPLSILCAYS